MPVVDLIEDGSWNEQLISQNILPTDRELILKIPLSHVPMKDKLFWHFDKRVIILLRVDTKLLCTWTVQ